MPDIITFMNPVTYDRYGKEMLDTFLHFWPSDLKLNVYFRGRKPDYSNNRIFWIDVNEVCPEIHNFEMKNKNTSSEKYFVIVHAGITSKSNKIVWISPWLKTCKKVNKEKLNVGFSRNYNFIVLNTNKEFQSFKHELNKNLSFKSEHELFSMFNLPFYHSDFFHEKDLKYGVEI